MEITKTLTPGQADSIIRQILPALRSLLMGNSTGSKVSSYSIGTGTP